MSKETKDLTARNRRQEDFIFTLQAKLDQESKEKAQLKVIVEQINQPKEPN